jgi:hypothetical protein
VQRRLGWSNSRLINLAANPSLLKMTDLQELLGVLEMDADAFYARAFGRAKLPEEIGIVHEALLGKATPGVSRGDVFGVEFLHALETLTPGAPGPPQPRCTIGVSRDLAFCRFCRIWEILG